MIPAPMYGSRVTNIKYVTYQPAHMDESINAMRVDLKIGKNIYVPNGDWTTENPALCVQAFLGVSPSTLDEAEGKMLPLTVRSDGVLDVPMFVVAQGAAVLDGAEWFASFKSESESDSALSAVSDWPKGEE